MEVDVDYQAFLAHKTQLDHGCGFEPIEIPEFLFPFQRHLVNWAIRIGRGAIFAACGLGKTLMQLTWADNVIRHTNGRVLIVTPLAVCYQTEREAKKFGFDAKVSRDGKVHDRITLTNFERLHYFNQSDFIGSALDESACLKAFGGKRRKQITRFFSKLPYRLLCSGLPSPNDFIELGTQSECLGVMTQSEMLTYFFRETQYMRHTVFREGDFWNTTKWYFKPHSEQPFWRWVSSWARAARLPSDLGFSDDGFILPPLEYVQSVVDVPYIPPGELFPRPAVSLREQREEAKKTTTERCEKVAEIVAANDGYSLVFCHLNPEGDALEKLIPGSVQVAGCDSDEWKEAALEWFAGYRCICGLTRKNVRDKLSTCQENHQTTKSDTIKNIVSENSQSPKHGSKITPNIERNTCRLTIQQTPKNSPGEPQNNRQLTMLPDVRNTKKMPNIEKSSKQKSKKIESSIPPHSSLVTCENTDSPSTITNDSWLTKEGDVPSATETIPEIAEDTDGTSITVTELARSGDCSATVAISDLASSEMMPIRSNERHCTCGHISGKRVLISKPKIAAWGLNYQHCHHIVLFPTHSYEAVHQGVSRCHRFGQKESVRVDVVSSPGEEHVIEGLSVKIKQADRMFEALCKYMNDSEAMYETDKHLNQLEIPDWLVGSDSVAEPVAEEPEPQCQWITRRTKADHTKPLQLPKWLGNGRLAETT